MLEGGSKGRPSAGGAARLSGECPPVLVIGFGQMVPAQARDFMRSGLQRDLHEGPVIEMGKRVRNAPLIVPAATAPQEEPIRVATFSHPPFVSYCTPYFYP
ncbi:hypothetical protein HNE_1429 [Hyphomonas neptunium ATCC 15444]|uniref:Uncharacterized protein n=1 Tax=Hyphomonas neptunium (strain ATCC 15444) TaxID=228405 RepID=Q0C298_HYPNA|nr:hypothetical protein HNE_1429 [Hyphomonas neptunium ATCC 15444]